MIIQEYLQRLLPGKNISDVLVTKITGEASNRQYFRIQEENNSRVLCIDPGFRSADPASYPFLVLHNILASAAIAVPRIYAADNVSGCLLMEDCGNMMLQDAVREKPELTEPLYHDVIDIMVQIQRIEKEGDAIAFTLSFDREKLMFEFDFFITHALQNNRNVSMGSAATAQLRRQFESITDELTAESGLVLNHRDYHCRNILIHNHQPVIIDFQDARMGLAQYDAASLLRDSYHKLDDSLLQRLQRYHYDNLLERNLCSTAFDEYLRLFDLMAFQRNIKALGTFFYQSTVVGNNSFKQYIEPTIAYLPDYINRHAELKTAGRIIMETLAPSLS